MKNNRDAVFAKCQYIRLAAELSAVDEALLANAPLEVDEEDNLGKKIVKRTKNALFREVKTKELSEKKEKILANIAAFKAENPKIDTEKLTDEDFTKNVTARFKRDKFDVNRELLGVSIILDGDYEYVLADEGLKKLSALLYEDEEALFEIKKNLEKLYTSIRKMPFPSKQNALLYGISAAILGVYAAAVAGIGAAVGVSAAVGATNAGLVSLYACLAGGALVGATYITLNETKRRKIKDEFAKLSLDESASLLAIRCHIISMLKKNSEDKHVKDEISDLLTLTDDLRADVSYELFVENEDVENNKAKLGMFHNFDNALTEILA